MDRNDIAYFSRRLSEERRRAAASDRAEIASTHMKFAAHYEHALASALADTEGDETDVRLAGANESR